MATLTEERRTFTILPDPNPKGLMFLGFGLAVSRIADIANFRSRHNTNKDPSFASVESRA